MKLPLSTLFKTGEFWSSLEATIKAIRKKIKQNSKNISEVETQNLILAERLKIIAVENYELKEKIKDLDKRLWELNIVDNSENSLIVKAGKEGEPNKKLKSQSSVSRTPDAGAS